MTFAVLLVTLLGTVVLTGSLMFLPAAIELLRPKDAGPRLISCDIALSCITAVVNMEEEHPINRQLKYMFTGTFPEISSLEL
jgi:hypothetical protein